MKYLLLIAMLLVTVNGAEYEECEAPEVYADWSSPEECDDYYTERDEAEQDESAEEQEDE